MILTVRIKVLLVRQLLLYFSKRWAGVSYRLFTVLFLPAPCIKNLATHISLYDEWEWNEHSVSSSLLCSCFLFIIALFLLLFSALFPFHYNIITQWGYLICLFDTPTESSSFWLRKQGLSLLCRWNRAPHISYHALICISLLVIFLLFFRW